MLHFLTVLVFWFPPVVTPDLSWEYVVTTFNILMWRFVKDLFLILYTSMFSLLLYAGVFWTRVISTIEIISSVMDVRWGYTITFLKEVLLPLIADYIRVGLI